jgi:IPT/TIG domain
LQSTWISETQLEFIVPPGTGVISIYVIVDGQQSTNNATFFYGILLLSLLFLHINFFAVETNIYSINPNFGNTFGGLILTISGQNFGRKYPPLIYLLPIGIAFVYCFSSHSLPSSIYWKYTLPSCHFQ